MTIIREHSILGVCLLAACGGAFDGQGKTFGKRDGTIVAATADSPGQAEVVCKNKVVFFGRSGAAVGETITAVTLDGSMVRRTCTGKVLSDRTWSCTQTLPDGGYSWTAQVTSGGPLSQQIDFLVNTDDEDDQAPTIDHTPSPNNDPKPVLTGTVGYRLVSNGLHLEVKENGNTLCLVDPIRSTNWACPLSTKLSDGTHLLAAKVEGKNGEEATPLGNPDQFKVKTSVGDPTLTAIPTPTSLDTIVFSGTGEPGAVVTVADGTAVLCQTTVAAAGRWSCVALDPLKDGAHAISVTQQDAAGNTSKHPTSASFVIDTRIPAAPTLDAPATPTSDPLVTFTGSGQAGARVSVLDSYSRTSCVATVSGSGAWSCAPAGGIADGDYLLTALQITPVGKSSGPSVSVPLSVRTLLAPLFDAPASPTRERSPLLSGRAQPAAAVSVFLGETAICSAQADATGRWSCRPEPALGDGSYLLQARTSNALSNASGPSAARSLRIDTQAPAAPVLDQPVLPTLKRQPILSGTAEAGSSVIVLELGSAAGGNAAETGAPICRATASAAGLFACSPEVALGAGEHRVTATATDDAGNASLQAEPVGVVVTEALTAPTIDSPANGTDVVARRPVIAGRTAPGTLVEVSVDGATFLAQMAPGGKWTLLPPQDLSLGTHEITASATDQGQNASDPAASRFSIVETGVARGGCASGGTPAPLLAIVTVLFAAYRRRRSSWAAALLIAAAPALVRAQELDLSIFRPAAGGDGFAAVEGARPPIAGDPRLEIRTWTDYAVHPLTFVTNSGETVLVRDRATQWLGVQMHLIGPLSVAAQLPVTLVERGDLSRLPSSSRGSPELVSGFADLRLTPRLSLLRQEWAGIDLATQLSLELPTARSQSFSGDGTVRGEGLVALGRRFGPVPGGYLDLLTNAYLRVRPKREFLDVRSGTEAGLRAGLGYAIESLRGWVPRRVYAEFEGRSFLRAGFAAGSSPAEWRVGGTLCPAGNLAMDFAGGGGLTDGIGAPRARFLFGLGWSPSACERRADAQLAVIAPPPVAAPVGPRPVAVAQALPLPAPPPMIVDRDGDGIPDADDACPEQAGPVENHGCPPGVLQRVIVSSTSLEILDRVHFATGFSRIEMRSYALLDQVAAVIRSHPHLLLIEVEGHTDDRGGAAYNILLSQARAAAVADYLVAKGVSRSRLVPRGFGPNRPVGSNGTTTGRAQNRRVAFTVVKTEARVIEAERPPDS